MWGVPYPEDEGDVVGVRCGKVAADAAGPWLLAGLLKPGWLPPPACCILYWAAVEAKGVYGGNCFGGIGGPMRIPAHCLPGGAVAGPAGTAGDTRRRGRGRCSGMGSIEDRVDVGGVGGGVEGEQPVPLDAPGICTAACCAETGD